MSTAINHQDIPASDLTDKQICEYLSINFPDNRAAVYWHGGWSKVLREGERRGLVERQGLCFPLTKKGKATLRRKVTT